jgi:hypothetical protein
MDPYLEKPVRWQGTHNMLIAYLAEALNAVLPARYVATIEVRCYIAVPERESIRPDLGVLETPGRVTNPGATALAVVGDPPLLLRGYAMEEQEAYIDIVDVENGERIVTAIELLSHTNKTLRNEGRVLYRAKQAELLASQTHLIEIDLLRAGEHTVTVPAPLLQPGDPRDYIVCLHRSGHGMEYATRLSSVRQRLPRIGVPLDEGIQDIELDLQAVLDHCYDAGRFDRKIDYTQAPIPPLRAEDAVWADTLLRERGLRN